MWTILALLIITASGYVVLRNLGTVARDTAQVVSDATQRAYSAGLLIQRTAFATLWLMIFALSYL